MSNNLSTKDHLIKLIKAERKADWVHDSKELAVFVPADLVSRLSAADLKTVIGLMLDSADFGQDKQMVACSEWDDDQWYDHLN